MHNPHPVISALLVPISMIYGLVVYLRNMCFDTGVFTSREFGIPVISVGNITVGGTGKTPHVEYIVSLLKDEFKVAVLSRGYKRKSSGFVVASTASGVEHVGDEPLQIKKKFPSVEVAVDCDRVRGIRNLCQYNGDLQVIVLDDAFQHRWVKPGISVLLVDFNQPPARDSLLPAGRLREPLSGKSRASKVIVTKCPPDMKPIERRILIKELSLFPWQSLYFTTFSYEKPMPVFDQSVPFPEREELNKTTMHILLVTGIASPGLLKKHLLNICPRIKQICYPDHHQFTKGDIHKIREMLEQDSNQGVIITTEKDAMRFREINNIDPVIKQNMYYIPINIRFIGKGSVEFKSQITGYVRKNKRNRSLC